MTKPKLTPAQQRAFDWLGESEEHCVTTRGAWHDPGGFCNSDFHPNTCAAMIRRGLLHEIVDGRYSYYIHPKFAGGSDDAPGNGGTE